jgi:hypothetical protein
MIAAVTELLITSAAKLTIIMFRAPGLKRLSVTVGSR